MDKLRAFCYYIARRALDWANRKPVGRFLLVFGPVPLTVLSFLVEVQYAQVITVALALYAGLCILHEWASEGALEERTRRILDDFGSKLGSKHQFGRYLVVYHVDPQRSGRADGWFREFAIKPEKGTTMVFLQMLHVGSTTDKIWRFADLQVRAGVKSPDGGDVCVIPTSSKEAHPRWGLQLLFTKPIDQTGDRIVEVSGVSPGVWAPLRRRGVDTGRFYLDVPAVELEISVILPRSWEDRPRAMTRIGVPNGDPQKTGTIDVTRNKSGDPQLTWTIQDAVPGYYVYRVDVTAQLP